MKQKLITPPYAAPLKEHLNRYLRDPVYMILLALTAAGSYGFWISHYSVSLDDLLYDYFYYGALFAQGRFTGSLVTRLFHLTDNLIWIQDFLGITFLCFAAILLCAFLDSYYKTKNHIPQILFSCLLVSYPLHATLFAYGGCSLAFGAGLTMTVCALFLTERFFETHSVKYLFFSAVPLIFAISWYESILILYVQSVLAALLLYQIGTKRIRFAELFANGLIYALSLIVAVVLEFILSKILIAVLRIPVSFYKANQVVSLDFSDRSRLFSQIRTIVLVNYLGTLVRSLFSPPMIVFGAAFLVLFIVGLVHGIRRKNAPLFWCFFGLLAINFVLPLFMGKVSPRTCQSFAFTVAFAAFLAYDHFAARTEKTRLVLSKVILVGLACLIVGQTARINGMFTADDMRYQQEKNLIIGVGDYLLEHDLDNKPFVFAGEVDFNESVKSRICVSRDHWLYQALLKVPRLGNYCRWLADNSRTDNYAFVPISDFCRSYINLAIYYANSESVMIKFFRFCGYDTIQYGTAEQQEEAQQYVNEMPVWPHQDSVRDMGDYVIVNLGESTMGWLN